MLERLELMEDAAMLDAAEWVVVAHLEDLTAEYRTGESRTLAPML